MQGLITLFFERGSFGAFVICLLLFFLAVYLTYFRKKSPNSSQKKNKLSEKKINLMSRNIILIILLFIQVICFFFHKISHVVMIDNTLSELLLVLAIYFSLIAINFYFLINLFPLWKNYLKTTHIFFRSIFFVIHLLIASIVTNLTEYYFVLYESTRI